ncbi:MAG: hypothetical protein OHK0029_26240 [Armatimonadaceae bacterium]
MTEETSGESLVISLTETTFADLGAHLLDLLHALEGKNIPIILVGGFGLFLRQERVRLTGIKTLYEYIPPIRATEDFDVLLKLELLADMDRVSQLRAVLDNLDYDEIDTAKYYQFVKKDTATETRRNVKIDLLARNPEEGDPQLPGDRLRVKPRNNNSPLHARRTPEAIAVEDGLTTLTVSGKRTDGAEYQGEVQVPHPYGLFLMKIFAFRDEEENIKNRPNAENLPYSQKHVSDIYTLAATLSNEENAQLDEYRDRYAKHTITVEAGQIIVKYFDSPKAMGAVRLAEAAKAQGDLKNLPDFLTLLKEVFPTTE